MTTTTRSPGGSVDDLDSVLTAYFQAEMPSPWPVMRVPQAKMRSLPRQRRLATARSRLALAAAVLLLIGGALFVSGDFRSIEPTKNGDVRDVGAGLEKMNVFLEQSPDGPTTIRITIDTPPAPR